MVYFLKPFRFEGGSPPCQEIFTIDESGSIRTTKGIDRESRIIANNVDDFGWLSCTVAYLTNDGNNSTRRIQIAIADVNDNAPEFSNLTGISVKENTNVNSIVQVFTVKDPDNGDNGTVDSVVLGGMDERFFHLVTSQVGGLVTVQLQASNENIDFEMYRQLNITLTATDRGTPPKTSSTEVTVTVEDINDNAPVFSYTQYNFKNVADTTPSDVPIGSVNATDDDEGIFGIVLYGITRVRGVGTSCGNVDELFAINSTTGAIYLNQSANGIRCEYTLRILAYNNHGDASRMGNAAVHVPIVAAVLVFEPPENYYTLIEERPSKLYTWTVKGGINCNNPQFNEMISSTHFCTMLPNSVTHSILFTGIDREETPFISGTIVVDSGAGPDEPPLPGTLNFNFTVLDINDNAPVFENTTFSVPENSRVGYEIGRVVAVDADEGDNGSVIYELLNSTHEDLITLDSNGMLVVNDTIDFEQVERIELFVIAQDQGTPPMDQEEIIYINIENLNDELPKFSNNFDQRILTTSSLPFIWYVTATDDDSGEFGEVTFRKVVTSTPNDASTFVTLNVSQLRIEELPEPSSTPYQLVVEAVDGGNGTSNVTITINVWTDICQDNPCRNGGICTNENNSYKCACTEDYGGENCSILKNPCEHTHPCLNGGSCSDTEDELDYRCTCTDNFSGRNCNYNTVSFKPRSFQSYQLPGVSANSRDLQVSVQVAPKFLNGLLLYVGEGDNFISMELDNGRVVMCSTPNGEISDNTMMVTTNGIWYLITMIMKSGTVSIVYLSVCMCVTCACVPVYCVCVLCVYLCVTYVSVSCVCMCVFL